MANDNSNQWSRVDRNQNMYDNQPGQEPPRPRPKGKGSGPKKPLKPRKNDDGYLQFSFGY
jgi:penicillin-binding protein 1A